MAKNFKYYGLIIFVTTIIFSSCNNDTANFQNTQKNVSLRGEALTAQLSGLYNSLSEMNNYFGYKKEYLIVITKNDSSVQYLFDGISFDNELIDSLNFIIDKTARVYRAYEMLTDISVGLEKSGIVKDVKFFYESIDFNSLSEEDKKILTDVKQASESKKFERKEIIYGVSSILLNIIQNDFEKEKIIINKFFEAYDKGLQKVQNSSFDYAKVENLVSEPYTDRDVLIGLYKLQLRNEANQSRNEILNKFSTLMQAAEKINAIHFELTKQKRDDDAVDRLMSETDLLLNYIEKE